jgi:hypothetical protein
MSIRRSDEKHTPDKIKLIEKKKVTGKGLGGDIVSCYKLQFSCTECARSYVRFIYSKTEFEKYTSKSIWKWPINKLVT